MNLPALAPKEWFKEWPNGWSKRQESFDEPASDVSKSDSLARSTTPSPTNTRFQLSWANADEKQWLDHEMGRLGRQRMNIRLMYGARFVLLKTETGEIAGWGGVDTTHDFRYPELFSLHVDPKYRKYSLGLLLTSSRATFLRSQGFDHAFLRVTRETTSALLRKQLESKYYSELNPRDLDPNYIRLCGNCELFGHECRQQVFLKFDINGFLAESEREIGPIDLQRFPQSFSLTPQIPLGSHHSAHPNSERVSNSVSRVHRLFRPIWLS